MTAPYRLVLWDFDGTLADTLRTAVAIYNRIAPKYHALPMTDPLAMRSLTMREMLRRHNVRCHRFPFLLREFLAEQNRTMTEVCLHEGIAETLTALTQAGLRHGIVSSNSEINIRTCLKHNQVEEDFEFVVGIGRLFGKRKALKQALRLAGLPPGEVLYVGDETRDIEAAHQIRIPIACVTWGVNTQDLLAEHLPEHLITEPGQLLEILQIPQTPPLSREA